MANIYERANIRAGDPFGRAKFGADKAATYFNQYQRQVDTIRDINEALGYASDVQGKRGRKATGEGVKNSLIAGLIAEGIMAALTAGASTALPGWSGALVGGGMQALGASRTHDFLNERYDATKRLDELKGRYKKGTKEYETVRRAAKLYDDAEEQEKLLGIGLGAIAGGIGGAGDLSKAITGWSTMDKAAKEALIKEGSEETIQAAKDQVVQKATIQPRFLGFDIDKVLAKIPSIQKKLPQGFGRAAEVTGKGTLEKASLADTIAGYLGVGDMAKGATGLIDDAPFLEDLLKYTAAPVATRALTPKPVFDPVYAEGFKNPYRRRI